MAGGSSGGSAVAVALGLCAAAVGTDTNGSIRVPAAYCGLVGLRPTYGRVSLDRVVPLAASYEQAGPIGRTIRDVRLLLAAMAAGGGGAVVVPGPLPLVPGRSPPAEPPSSWSPAGSPSPGPFTFAVAREAFLASAEEPVRVTVERALDRLAAAGHELREVRLPRTARGTLATAAITSRESAVAVPDEAVVRGEGLGTVARERLASRHAVSDEALREARAAVDPIREELLAVLEHADVVSCATSPLLAPLIDDTDRPSPVPGLALGRYIGHFTAPFGLAGLPCLSLPCGQSPEGLPVGLQLVGRPWEEDQLLAVAEVVEQALDGVALGLP